MSKPKKYTMPLKLQKAILRDARDIAASGKKLSIKPLLTMHMTGVPLCERRQRDLVSKLLEANGIERPRIKTSAKPAQAPKKPAPPEIKPADDLNKVELQKEFEAGANNFKSRFESLKRSLAEIPQIGIIDVDQFLYDKAKQGNIKAFMLLTRVIGK